MHSRAAIESIYSGSLKFESYQKQREFLFSQAAMYSDIFSYEMRQLGHDAEEIIYDVEPLQKAWAKEHGVSFNDTDWQEKILLAQLASLKPEVVYFQDIHSLSYEARAGLKEKIPSIKKIVIFRGFPGADGNLFKELSTADLLLVGSPVLLKLCRREKLKPHLVYHFFDRRILGKLKNRPESLLNFTFIGSSGYGYGKGHRDRYWMLTELLKKTDIRLWIDEPGSELRNNWKGRLRSELISLLRAGIGCLDNKMLEGLKRKSGSYPKFQRLVQERIDLRKEARPILLPKRPLIELFSDRCKPPVFGVEMYQLLRDSKVVLNKHSNAARGTADNIRLFQATGVGSCLLTDHASNMSQLFEEDREVVTYRSIDECIEKSRFLLSQERIRNAIAQAGQKRTLKDHNSEVRMKQIDRLIQVK